MLVERIGDLQPLDERRDGHVVIAVIHQGHLALEITDIVLKILPRLHPDSEEVIAVFLQLRPRSVLVVKDLLHLSEESERLPQERVEPFIGSAFETEGEHTTQEEVVMRVNHHLILVLSEVLDRIGRPRVVFEG